MNYKIEIKKIIYELTDDIEKGVKCEDLAGPFDDEWIKSQKSKLQLKEELQDIVDRLE